ncbi:MAG: DegT/DnrJ/EryC1/StrS family aminotransferase [Bacteroidales bacterium]|nr:DegT/DnrJ/EryC1/StrS family aminotransferase [Bacteroidales bacterium]
MNIPYSRISLDGNEINYLREVLKSGWLTTSSKALEFEKQFAKFIGAQYTCVVNSCTSALHLAVEAIGIKKDDKVLVPSLTFTSSAEVLRYLGADPVFVDVEYETGLISPAILEKAIRSNPGAKAIILVHYGGQAAEMVNSYGNGIVDICKRNKIHLIEDAAHAFPTKFGDKFIGTFGDITCFSFYANKTITSGEGGMVATSNPTFCDRIKIMRLHGINHDVWDRFTHNHSKWEYDIIGPGYKYNMPDINAAIGLAQLELAEFYRLKRQKCAEFYFEKLDNIKGIDLPVCYGPLEYNSWHLFPIKITPEARVSRNEFIRIMADRGIGTSVHYKPLHRMYYYKNTYNLNPDDFPNTEKIWQGTVSLPIYPKLKKSELVYICKTIKDILT